MDLSICSYSFHRLLADGKQDMFKYIADCKELGATLLDPWNAHLAPLQDSETVLQAGSDPENAQLFPQQEEYLERVKRAADDAGLPFGCIAVDGAHIYEPTPEARQANRALAYQWLEVADRLGARQIRIDAGGPEEMPDDVFQIIIQGYWDLVARGRGKGIEILMENHFGPSRIPENVVKIMEAVDGLGLLFDTTTGHPVCGREAGRCVPGTRQPRTSKRLHSTTKGMSPRWTFRKRCTSSWMPDMTVVGA